LLHVYELDPLPIEARDECKRSENGNKNDEIHTIEIDLAGEETDAPVRSESNGLSEETVQNEDKSDEAGLKYSFLAIAQRRSEVVSRDVLHPFSHRVFGTPLLLRVHELEGFTGRNLYDLIARRLRNFVPKSALRFLTDYSVPLKTEDETTEENGEQREKTRNRTRERQLQTLSDMEDVSAGPVPRYGFRLRVATRDGRRCALCPWYECCIGCLVPDDENPTIVMCGDSVALDWHFAVDIATSGFGLRTNQSDQNANPVNLRSRIPGVPVKNHSSCGAGAKQRGCAGATTLEDCLEEFAREERIPEVRVAIVMLLQATLQSTHLF
jgi:hypothetical protein